MVPGQFMCLPQFFEYPTNGNVTGVSRLILPLIRTIAAAGLLAGGGLLLLLIGLAMTRLVPRGQDQ